ncbi:MAG: hypothetical protein ACRD0K_21755 [Egibacteraceae bacterium]
MRSLYFVAPRRVVGAALAEAVAFPVKYGCAAVGRVARLGVEVSREWRGRLVVGCQTT